MAQILGPMVLRHFLKVLALARILGPTVLRHFLDMIFAPPARRIQLRNDTVQNMSLETVLGTQRYLSKHCLMNLVSASGEANLGTQRYFSTHLFY